MLDESDRSRYADSLELIAGLNFNILIPWASTAGQPYYAFTEPAETRRRIDEILDRMWRGKAG